MARAAQVATFTLLAAAVLEPLWRGGAGASAIAVGLAACVLALAAAAWGAGGAASGVAGRAWAAPALLGLLAAAQCMPLPPGLLRELAPVSADLRGGPPGWAPLSLDAPATLASLAFLAAVAMAAAGASLIAAGDRHLRRWLLMAPVIAAVPQALLVLAGAVLAGPPATGTFVNRNHAGALLAAGALAALGPALGAQLSRRTRRLLGAAAAACAMAAALTLSRGAFAVLIAGGIALVALQRSRRPVRLAVIGGCIAAVVTLLIAGEAVSGRLARLSPSRVLDDVKLRSFAGAIRVAGDHWLTGAGRGAYRFVSDRHRSVEGDERFHFVENGPLQLAVDVGVPGALLVLAVLGLALVAAVRRSRRSAFGQGALVALAALLAQNLVDFNLELLGVALPFALALGAASAPREVAAAAPQRDAAGAGPPGARLAAICGVGVIAAASLMALRWGTVHSAEREGDAFLARIRDRSVSLPDLLREADRLAARHPADEVIGLATARALHERGRPREALAWVNKALRNDPGSPRAHALAAAVLASAGRKAQARVELKLAWSNRRYNGISTETLELAERLCRDAAELVEATPDDAIVRAELGSHLHARGRSQHARGLLEHELARIEGAPHPRSGDRWAHAEASARARVRSTLARLAEERGDAAEANRLRSGVADAWWRQQRLVFAFRHAPASEGPVAPAPLDVLDSFDALGLAPPTAPHAAEQRLLRAELLEAAGQRQAGLAERWMAAQLDADRPERALDYAERLLAEGDRAGAIEALRAVIRLASGAYPKQALADRLRQLEAGPTPDAASRAAPTDRPASPP